MKWWTGPTEEAEARMRQRNRATNDLSSKTLTVVVDGPEDGEATVMPLADAIDNEFQFYRWALVLVAVLVGSTVQAENKPNGKTFHQCYEERIPRVGRVKAAGIMADPARNKNRPNVQFDMLGSGTVTIPGRVSLQRGEIIASAEQGPNQIVVTSLGMHSVKRGLGAFQHQSPERVQLEYSFVLGSRPFDCDAVAKVWGESFEAVTGDALRDIMDGKTGAGLVVEEVSAGMSPSEVESILGPPDRLANLTGKTVYFYPKMKVTFVDGKVADVE